MNSNLISGIVESLDAKSDWRREKAAETTGDLDNAFAALRLATLAQQFKAGDYDPALMARYAALLDSPDTVTQVAMASSEIEGEVGFGADPETPDEFLNLVFEKLQ